MPGLPDTRRGILLTKSIVLFEASVYANYFDTTLTTINNTINANKSRPEP